MLRFVSFFGPFLEEKLPEIGTDDDMCVEVGKFKMEDRESG